jgi:hypothetical protein
MNWFQDGRVTRQEIVDLINGLGGDPDCPHAQVGQSQSKTYFVTNTYTRVQ